MFFCWFLQGRGSQKIVLQKAEARDDQWHQKKRTLHNILDGSAASTSTVLSAALGS